MSIIFSNTGVNNYRRTVSSDQVLALKSSLKRAHETDAANKITRKRCKFNGFT